MNRRLALATSIALSLVIQGANAQDAPADRTAARQHAGCANAYAAMLARPGADGRPDDRALVQKMETLHTRIVVALAGEDDGRRLLKSTRAALQMALSAVESTSGDNGAQSFFSRRVDTCTKLVGDLSDEQRARVGKALD